MVEVSERWVVAEGEGGSDFPLAVPIHTLITVRNVEEKVLFMMLLRNTARGEKRCYCDIKNVFNRETHFLKRGVRAGLKLIPGTRVPWWLRWVE